MARPLAHGTPERDLTEVEQHPEYVSLVVRQMAELSAFTSRQAQERVLLALTIRKTLSREAQDEHDRTGR